MDKPEHIWFLMARNLGGEASAEEQQELMQLLQQHPQWMQQYDMMKTLWKPAGKPENTDDEGKIRHILQLAAAETEEAPVPPTAMVTADRTPAVTLLVARKVNNDKKNTKN